MIDVKNLTKNYGSFQAVKDVSFFIDKGEVVGFLGPNAAGKTTTMRILTCYMSATEGKVSIAGFDVFENSMSVKKRIGYLPEHPPLYHEMTVESYLTFVGKIKGLSGKDLKIKLDRVLERTSTLDVRKRLIAKISKGYKQRVGIAQALIHDPEVLVLDEPTVGLDPKQIIEVRELIKELGEDHTIILSTHILPEVSATCGRVIIINNGRIVAEDTSATPRRMMASRPTPTTRPTAGWRRSHSAMSKARRRLTSTPSRRPTPRSATTTRRAGDGMARGD